MNIVLPLHVKWRSYQQPLWNAMVLDNCRRGALVWHRRTGKDLTALNVTIAKMFQRPGTYYYFFPSYAQAKKVIWNGQDREGRPFLSYFPSQCIEGRWEDEMMIRLNIGRGKHSDFQLIGVDKLGSEKAGDSIVGTNAVGIVMSEYSLMSERAWNLMRPVLRENGGWALFIYTPRGKNHAHRMWQNAKTDANWFASLKNVDDTRRDAEGENGSPVITREDIEADIREGMDPALVKQEYYCSFEGALQGSYYGDLIVRAREEGRIHSGLFDPRLVVDTGWDLGVDDATALGFTQTVGPSVRFIDYYENAGVGLAHYADYLRSKPHYRYGIHYGPHDLKVTEWGTGNTRLQRAQAEGLNFEVVPKLHIADGIEAVRRMLVRAEFDEEKCSAPEFSSPESGDGTIYTARKHGLIEALMAYRREWDEKLATWRATPVHDWASHAADMVRYRAIAHFDLGNEDRKESYDGDWRIFEKPRQESYEQWSVYGSE